MDKNYIIPDKFDPLFDAKYAYDGELGALYTAVQTEFRLWAPLATKVILNFFKSGDKGKAYETLPMTEGERGVWSVVAKGDMHGTYYTYDVTNHGTEQKDVVDPYARACGVNGLRGMVVDLAKTNPDGWTAHKRPQFDVSKSIIYEVHIRDFTISPDSGVSDANKGKFLGLTERGTVNLQGGATCLDHMVELGVNTIHLLPSFDFLSIDETKLDQPQFNWGYDPRHYNIPAGSYSHDPYNGAVRIKEFKQMVKALHESGIKVVMDVVYNHTFRTDIGFEQVVPKYYYRYKDGRLNDGSLCGNETASERAMMRKFMVDSVIYWAKEYAVDGFRFDLMGLHDVDTMNLIAAELAKINPDIIVYGEGWYASEPAMTGIPALKKNAKLMPGIAVFSDDLRDGVKGCVFDKAIKGWIGGNDEWLESVKFGIVGAVEHIDVNIDKVKYSDAFWALSPLQQISYVSCHDNYTLWDKLSISCHNYTADTRRAINKLAASIVFLSQGIPFILAGEELLRSKPIYKHGKLTHEVSENSYNLDDKTNQIVWDTKTKNHDVAEHYRALIALRQKLSDVFMTTGEEVRQRSYFVKTKQKSVIGYKLAANGRVIYVYHNAGHRSFKTELAADKHQIIFGRTEPKGKMVVAPPLSTVVVTTV